MPNIWSSLALAGTAAAASQRFLAPENDIKHPASETATNPLTWLGANSPWFAGDNVYDISSSVPDGCYVDMAAYNVRHGSRYPDNGAYNGWVDMYERFQNASLTGTGSLSFLSSWSPVLTDPSTQIAQLSPTGWKEAFDLGYKLRTQYPSLYTATSEETQTQYVWANDYPRVIQTARLFLRGYLGTNATLFGRVVSVNPDGDGHAEAIGNSLSPSDACPNFDDDGGRDEQAEWGDGWIPAAKARLAALLEGPGDFELADSDVTQVPYLCGFESQILGRLSPWCGVFADDELRSYEYWNDLRYFYGVGAGTDLPKKMMTPYLSDLVGILADGPGQTGASRDGNGTFEFPSLVVAFMNDGQINELAVASGVYDEQVFLNTTVRDDERLFMARRLSTMRGTVAFERLVCEVGGGGESGSGSSSGSSSGPGSSSGSGSGSGSGRNSGSGSSNGGSYGFGGWGNGTDVSYGSGGHGTGTGTVGGGYPSETGSSGHDDGGDDEDQDTTSKLTTRSSPSSNAPTKTKSYIRILLNDAVYTIPSCQSGPGSSCPMDQYVQYMADKMAEEGNWMTNCNVTDSDAPSKAGASFFKDLTGDYIEIVEP
ncbi:histidine acid phosphatase [Zalerion maritima]|uniref:Histidine acid phosphatase n=1 Tax=Zalerion maritima TaxID=339359 RepID=A0AAD5RNM9_9PEZI|nr:histidine acid phosphatase [Zalerion maritima]